MMAFNLTIFITGMTTLMYFILVVLPTKLEMMSDRLGGNK
jgi:hypothetical protein